MNSRYRYDIRRFFNVFLLAAALLVWGGPAGYAAITLPPVFGDHMVLQREMRVPVWGKAAPGEKVTVRFAGQEKSAVAGPDGSVRSHARCEVSQTAIAPMDSGETTTRVAAAGRWSNT